jgi:hypothetical protein
MQVRGALASSTYGAEPDIAIWARQCLLNPARIDPSQAGNRALLAASERLASVAQLGLERLAAVSSLSLNEF